MYLRFKDQLFDGWTRPYSAEKLEKHLKSEFGENTTMSEVKKTKCPYFKNKLFFH